MESKLKKGDLCVMHTCGEADMPKYKGKLWTCRTDSYIDKAGQEVVFLEGFSGCFMCDYLAPVNANLIEQNKKLWDVLDEARLQIEYMQNKFAKTGTGESVLATINRILNEFGEG